ncbi:hypothetical protein GIB67_018635 [Kingdonia uniflora]|uniref:RRM domain-containing protein n=1 Tax=Kingdonia uniflora TaxID=39325 RepID=A0A7J7M2H6_9MAGN|nr:hypothetical protein GIB67_018635 [Kingdonia uniflora]
MAGTGYHHPYHQQWNPPPQLTPPSIPIENPNRTTTEEVRTIFISGLPEDVKERELQNLLRWLPGYEASQVNYKGGQPMGFGLFSTGQFAVSARDALQEMVFDADAKSVLHTEMAKKNLFVKRGVVVDSNSIDQSKRLRTGGDYVNTGYPSTSPFPNQPPAPVWGHQGYMAPAPSPYNPYGGYPLPQIQMPTPIPMTAPVQVPAPMPMPAPASLPSPSVYAPIQNVKDNPPCNTLFIGNLGENTTEEELRGMFSIRPGFKQMKVLKQERNTVCFIEFNDLSSAINVHQSLQGAVIPSSGRGGMRIQYPSILPLHFYYYITKRIRRTHLGDGRILGRWSLKRTECIYQL